MATPTDTTLPPALELVDRLSPETAEGIAQMDEENADMCRRLLRGVGLDALNDVIDLLRPEVAAG